MTITIECDSDQPRNPDNQPPPYRDDCEITEESHPYGWTCPCGEECSTSHVSKIGAAKCLALHLSQEHGE